MTWWYPKTMNFKFKNLKKCRNRGFGKRKKKIAECFRVAWLSHVLVEQAWFFSFVLNDLKDESYQWGKLQKSELWKSCFLIEVPSFLRGQFVSAEAFCFAEIAWDIWLENGIGRLAQARTKYVLLDCQCHRDCVLEQYVKSLGWLRLSWTWVKTSLWVASTWRWK